MKCFVFAGMLLCASRVSAQTNEPQAGMWLPARQFSDCTDSLAAGPDEPWRASWNDPGQMATRAQNIRSASAKCQLPLSLDARQRLPQGNTQ